MLKENKQDFGEFLFIQSLKDQEREREEKVKLTHLFLPHYLKHQKDHPEEFCFTVDPETKMITHVNWKEWDNVTCSENIYRIKSYQELIEFFLNYYNKNIEDYVIDVQYMDGYLISRTPWYSKYDLCISIDSKKYNLENCFIHLDRRLTSEQILYSFVLIFTYLQNNKSERLRFYDFLLTSPYIEGEFERLPEFSIIKDYPQYYDRSYIYFRKNRKIDKIKFRLQISDVYAKNSSHPSKANYHATYLDKKPTLYGKKAEETGFLFSDSELIDPEKLEEKVMEEINEAAICISYKED